MIRAMTRILGWVLALMLMLPPAVSGQGSPTFKQEELDQMLAPIALYPDSLLTQILMASTYPLEVVQQRAGRNRTRISRGMH